MDMLRAESRAPIFCLTYTYMKFNCELLELSSSKCLDRDLKHECYIKLIHIMAHLSLGDLLRGACNLVVRSLPTFPHWQSASFGPQFTCWSVRRSAGPHFTTASHYLQNDLHIIGKEEGISDCLL